MVKTAAVAGVSPGAGRSLLLCPRLLIVDSDDQSRQAIIRALEQEGADALSVVPEICEAGTLASARAALQAEEFICVFAGHDLPDGTGQELLMEMRHQGLATPVILLTEEQDDPAALEQAAFEVMQAGGAGYLPAEKLHADTLARPLIARSLHAALRFQQVQRERQALLQTALADLHAHDSALASSSHGIVIADPRQPDCPIIYTNEAFLRMTGYTSGEVIGRNCRFLQGAGTDPATTREMREAIQSERGCQISMQNYRKDGSAFWNDVTISPVRDKHDALIHFVGIQSDTTVRHETEGERVRLLGAAAVEAARMSVLYERERRIAEALQCSLLAPPPNQVSSLEVETIYRPAWDEAQVGGDFYDYFLLDENRLALVVGDVCGKGLQAASRTAEVKYTLRAYLRERTDAASALKRLNAFLCASQAFGDMDQEYFVILTLIVLHSVTGVGEIAVAGAEAPLIRRAGGQVEEVPVRGLPLGVVPDAEYQAVPVCLEGDEVLLVSTDGITEARQGHEFLGSDGLADLMRHAPADGTLVEIGAALLHGAQEYATGPLHDDVCLLLVRLRSSPSALTK